MSESDDRKCGANTGDRTSQGRFAPGNPGKLPGTRHKATLAAEALLDGEAETITRQVIELAKQGDRTALRLCMERIAPPRRERPIGFALPKLETAEDSVRAVAAVTEAVAAGEVTPAEAEALVRLIEAWAKAHEVFNLEARVHALEDLLTAGTQTNPGGGASHAA